MFFLRFVTPTICLVSDILFNISVDNTRCQIHIVNSFVRYRSQSYNQPFKDFIFGHEYDIFEFLLLL